MPIGAEDQSKIGTNVLYARDIITLRGGKDARGQERKRLQPGDRLADGTLWTGNTRLDGLKKVAANLKSKIDNLQAELEKVMADIAKLEPIAIDESEVNPPSPRKKPKRQEESQEV